MALLTTSHETLPGVSYHRGYSLGLLEPFNPRKEISLEPDFEAFEAAEVVASRPKHYKATLSTQNPANPKAPNPKPPILQLATLNPKP